MISFPFDNTSQEVQDRNIDSDVFAEYLKRLTGGNNGVFAEVGTKMQVTATGGMTVKVKPGDGFIEGRIFINDIETELPMESAESLDRIDTVVVRLSKANRETTLAVVKGTASSAPSAPALTRESGVYELGLANVLVKKNTVNITQAEVTDTRLNDQRCGVAPVLGQIDTQGLYDQYQSSLDQSLETVAQAIDGTLAGQLQANIDEVKNEIRPISTGGTGATTVAGARNALGLGNTSGALPISNGGTGKTTAAEALVALGIEMLSSANSSGRVVIGKLGIEWGTSGTLSLPANSDVHTNITFASSFKYTPYIGVGLENSTYYPNLFLCNAFNRAKTGFTFNFKSTYSSATTVSGVWFAIGEVE